MIDGYDWAGGREAMLRFGPADGPVVIAALPLFEEANRTRAFAVTILRALAERGIAAALPELPGTGESLVPTEDAAILAMRQAFAAAAEHVARSGRAVFAVAIRSGALLDALAPVAGRWQLAPVAGLEVLRELTRIKQAEVGATKLPEMWFMDPDAPDDADPAVVIAGNIVSPSLLTELMSATPATEGANLRVVRLDSDPRPADRKLPGPPLWRRAEPGNDLPLAHALADDIAAWIGTCAD